ARRDLVGEVLAPERPAEEAGREGAQHVGARGRGAHGRSWGVPWTLAGPRRSTQPLPERQPARDRGGDEVAVLGRAGERLLEERDEVGQLVVVEAEPAPDDQVDRGQARLVAGGVAVDEAREGGRELVRVVAEQAPARVAVVAQ